MSYEQLIFLIRLLSLHKSRISTRCIQWIIAYMVDNEDGELGSTDDVSLYMGFNRLYYSQCVREMVLRNRELLGVS